MKLSELRKQPWFGRNTAYVLMYIMSLYDDTDDEYIEVSRRQLSKDLSLTERELRTALDKLRKFGIVSHTTSQPTSQPIGMIKPTISISYEREKLTNVPANVPTNVPVRRNINKEEISPYNPYKEEINKEEIKKRQQINLLSLQKQSCDSSQGAAQEQAQPLNEKKSTEAEGVKGKRAGEPLNPHTHEDKLDYVAIAKYVNDKFSTPGCRIPKITGIKANTHRRDWTRNRITEYGKEKFAEVIRKAAVSDFLNGRTVNHPRPFDYDWMMRPNNFPKILEGRYDNKPQVI